MTTVDAAALLWTSADFDAPLFAARDRLERIRMVAGRDPTLAETAPEFLAKADRVLATPFELWADPHLTWWTTTACTLLDAEPFDRSAFGRQLVTFGRVDLGEMQPTARYDGYSVVVNPAPFDLPGWEKGEPAVAAGVTFHEQHVRLVEQTLGAMHRYAPDDFAAFRRVIRMIGLKPVHAGGYDDFSEPLLPGSFIASVVENPIVLADHFIHELQHNRLSFVEERSPLFDRGQAAGGYYSPWRESARSLLGVFHGVYVFLAVHRYWEAVLCDAEDGLAAYALDRVARLPVQLALAVRMLRAYASLTPLGTALLDDLTARVDTVRSKAEKAGLQRDPPAYLATDDGAYVRQRGAVDGAPMTVGSALREHLATHVAGAQCAALVADLWPFSDMTGPR